MVSAKPSNRYLALIEKIFFDKYKAGLKDIRFERDELERAASALKIKLPKNLGDVIYSLRYRADMPSRIVATQPKGLGWIIEGVGRAQYAFKLVKLNRILPRSDLVRITLPDATPELIREYAQGDEQALLAIVRYNRLIDVFLGVTTYSLQNHLRSTIKNGSQIEIDELYVGIDTDGRHYVIPVQAKGGNDQLSVVQIKQDMQWCAERFPELRCRAISAQFMPNNVIAMFELVIQEDEIRVALEKHYLLVPNDELDREAIKRY